MGSSSSCGCNIDNTAVAGKKIFLLASKNVRDLLICIKKAKQISLDVFLISTKSIPKFISLINKYKILENLQNDVIKKLEDDVEKEIFEYEIEKGLEIIYDLNQINQNIETNNFGEREENEFIIVDKDFLQFMNIGYEEKKQVEIFIDNEKKQNKIIFNNSKKDFIKFTEKKNGIYQMLLFNGSVINCNSNHFMYSNFINAFTFNSVKSHDDLNTTWNHLIKAKVVTSNDNILDKLAQNSNKNL